MSIVVCFFGIVSLFLFHIYHSAGPHMPLYSFAVWTSILLFKHHTLLRICFISVKCCYPASVIIMYLCSLHSFKSSSVHNHSCTTTVWLNLQSPGTTGWTASIVAIGYNPNNNPRILPLIPNLPIPPSFTAKQAPVRMSIIIYNCVVKDNAAQHATPRREPRST